MAETKQMTEAEKQEQEELNAMTPEKALGILAKQVRSGMVGDADSRHELDLLVKKYAEGK